MRCIQNLFYFEQFEGTMFLVTYFAEKYAGAGNIKSKKLHLKSAHANMYYIILRARTL